MDLFSTVNWDWLPLPLAVTFSVQLLCIGTYLGRAVGGVIVWGLVPGLLGGLIRNWGYHAINNQTCAKQTWPWLKAGCAWIITIRSQVPFEAGENMSFTHERAHLLKVNLTLVVLNCIAMWVLRMCWYRFRAPARVVAAAAAAAAAVSCAANNATAVAAAAAREAADTAARAVTSAASVTAAAAVTAAARVAEAASLASATAHVPVSGSITVTNGFGSAFGHTIINGHHNHQVYNKIYGHQEVPDSNADVLALQAGRLI